MRDAAEHTALAHPPRLGRNALANMAFDVKSALGGIVLTPFLLDRLGTVAFGVWALAGTVIGYLELFELGFGRATVKLIAEDAGRRPDAVVRTLNTRCSCSPGSASWRCSSAS